MYTEPGSSAESKMKFCSVQGGPWCAEDAGVADVVHADGKAEFSGASCADVQLLSTSWLQLHGKGPHPKCQIFAGLPGQLWGEGGKKSMKQNFTKFLFIDTMDEHFKNHNFYNCASVKTNNETYQSVRS